jgi:hypothetical protein
MDPSRLARVYLRRPRVELPPPSPGSSTPLPLHRFAKLVHVYQRHAHVAALTSSLAEPLMSDHPVLYRDPCHVHPMVTHRATGMLHPVDRLALLTIIPDLFAFAVVSPVPSSVHGALVNLHWLRAMEEYEALLANHTWDLVLHPTHCSVVTSKWVFTHKKDDGFLDWYKAIWVLQGFTQRLSVIYDESFSPVVKPATIHIVLALVVSCSWPVQQLYVKNAFLHGTLTETVYCSQPTGFGDPTSPDPVCRLNKSLYGLKQAPWVPYSRFATFLLSLWFGEDRSDASLFIYHQGANVIYLLLYVDDIMILSLRPLAHFATSDHHCPTTGVCDDLGQLHHFLGIVVEQRFEGLFLQQRHYTLDILDRAGMTDCKPCSTSVDTQAKISSVDGAPVVERTAFRSLGGALLYLTFTRLIFPLLFSRCVFICMIPMSRTSPLSSGFFATFATHSTSVFSAIHVDQAYCLH